MTLSIWRLFLPRLSVRAHFATEESDLRINTGIRRRLLRTNEFLWKPLTRVFPKTEIKKKRIWVHFSTTEMRSVLASCENMVDVTPCRAAIWHCWTCGNIQLIVHGTMFAGLMGLQCPSESLLHRREAVEGKVWSHWWAGKYTQKYSKVSAWSSVSWCLNRAWLEEEVGLCVLDSQSGLCEKSQCYWQDLLKSAGRLDVLSFKSGKSYIVWHLGYISRYYSYWMESCC